MQCRTPASYILLFVGGAPLEHLLEGATLFAGHYRIQSWHYSYLEVAWAELASHLACSRWQPQVAKLCCLHLHMLELPCCLCWPGIAEKLALRLPDVHRGQCGASQARLKDSLMLPQLPCMPQTLLLVAITQQETLVCFSVVC